MQVFTCDERGDVYINASNYSEDMLKTTTYGSVSELKAAAALYPFIFEVYQNGRLQGLFGDDPRKPVKRLRFTGSFLGGHYEVLIPDNNPIVSDLQVNENTSQSLSSTEPSEKNHRTAGRPKKVKRGRPKTSNISRSQQLTEAAARYRRNNPEKRKETLELYSCSQPEVHRDAVDRYTASHPEVIRNAVVRYTASHPEVHRAAVARYTASHPEVNRNAVVRYTASHPEAHRAAVARYTASHPKVNRNAVVRYTASHPEVHRVAVARYNAAHPKVNQAAVARYKDLNPQLNLESVRRKRSNNKLKLKLNNLENYTQALTKILNDRLEAEKIIKWTVHRRQEALGNFTKNVDKIKGKLKTSLEKLSVCPPNSALTDKLEAFLGKSEHRNNQEPYYGEKTYKVYGNKDKAIKINDAGKAVFGDLEKQ
ncbi:hypothetical protein ABMA28_005492, partial [Loxostege sticticalis]